MTLGEMMLRFGCAADIFSYPALEASMRDETDRPLPLDVGCPWPAARGRIQPAEDITVEWPKGFRALR